MAGLIAIGVGCRKGCASEAIVALVQRMAVGEFVGERALFTAEAKRGEANLEAAARALGLPLHFVAPERLAIEAPRAATRSAVVERWIGLPSLAETAALAGAGPGGRLIRARIAAAGATCAVAYRAEAET